MCQLSGIYIAMTLAIISPFPFYIDPYHTLDIYVYGCYIPRKVTILYIKNRTFEIIIVWPLYIILLYYPFKNCPYSHPQKKKISRRHIYDINTTQYTLYMLYVNFYFYYFISQFFYIFLCI